MREAAVESAGLYALKYSEEFLPHAPGFVTAAWGALVDAGPQPKYDAVRLLLPEFITVKQFLIVYIYS